MDTKALKAQLEALKANTKAYKAKRAEATGAPSLTETQSFEQIEKKACAKYGVKSLTGSKDKEGFNVDGLLQINTASKKYAWMSETDKANVKNLKEAVDVTIMCAARFGKKPNQVKSYEDELQPALKALGINSGDAGFQWIPTMVADSYVEEFNLDRKVAGLFTEVKMPSNPYTYPVLSNGAIATLLGEATAKSPSDTFNTQATIMFNAVKLTNQYALPDELQEDSAPDVMKVIRMELIQGQEKAMEIAIIEGDTASTNQHAATQIPGASGAPTSPSSETVFDGLRKRALAAGAIATAASSTDSPVTNANGQVVNESHLSSARKSMGKFGVNPAELAIICGPKVYNELLQLDDVRTLEQYGPQAPVLSGELAKYEGIPVVVSEYCREDLAASGVNTSGGPNSFGSLFVVNRKRWYTGMRRAIQVRVENYRTQFDVWDMVSFSRRAFQGVLLPAGTNYAGTGSGITGEKSIALIINIA